MEVMSGVIPLDFRREEIAIRDIGKMMWPFYQWCKAQHQYLVLDSQRLFLANF
jgi:hypothetical protein